MCTPVSEQGLQTYRRPYQMLQSNQNGSFQDGVLPYFDVNADTTLWVDASKRDLGACLIQNKRVISFASCALTKTWQN